MQKDLTDFGIKVWLDKTDVTIGSNIYENIDFVLSRVKESCGAIVVFDDSFFYKKWCKKELDFFIKNEIPIYPLLFDITKDDYPKEYENLKKIDRITINSINDPNYFDYLNKILLTYIHKKNCKENSFEITTEIFNDLLNSYLFRASNQTEKIVQAQNIAQYIYHYNLQFNNYVSKYTSNLIRIVNTKLISYYKVNRLTLLDSRVVESSLNSLISIYSSISID